MISATPSQFAAGLWCTYDHHINGGHVFTGFCRLNDVFTLNDARQNSAWQTATASDQPLTVSVVALGTKQEMMRTAAHRVKTMRPYANIHGLNHRGFQRKISCSNGQTYQSQIEAAQILGISQSQISRHMNGEFRHVRGLVFKWSE